MCYEDNFFSFLGSVLGKVGGRVGAANCWLCESARIVKRVRERREGIKQGRTSREREVMNSAKDKT